MSIRAKCVWTHVRCAPNNRRMLYDVGGEGVSPLPPTKFADAGLYEKHIEDWVEARPDLLGEELLIIGRQVALDEGKDILDLLAMDRQANLVIIELKRDLLGGAADLQPLRYAALISTWSHERVREQAEGYWKTIGASRSTFAQEVEQFCDEEAQVNGDQRLILAGRDITARLGTVALWLRSHGIDTKVVTLSAFEHGDTLLVQPQVVIPVPSEQRIVGAVSSSDATKPWKIDGRSWHLDQRLSEKGRAIAEAVLDAVATAIPDALGPNWQQKNYVSWQRDGKNWLVMYTDSPNQASAFFPANADDVELAAQILGWATFDGELSLAEKLAMGSSVGVDGKSRLRLLIKSEDVVVGSSAEAFRQALQALWASSDS